MSLKTIFLVIFVLGFSRITGIASDTNQSPPQASINATYSPQTDWPSTAVRDRLGLCASVAINSKAEVHVFHRANRTWTSPLPTEPIAEATIVVIDALNGKLLRSLGSNYFVMPHSITIDREDNLWVTDVALHQVIKLSPSGEPLLILGESRHPGSGPTRFNMPTDVAQLSDGSIVVSDGYRNARVVHFDAKGRYLKEWGRSGKAEGEFRLPHAIATNHEDHIYVCDRTNARVQIFDATGALLRIWNLAKTGAPYGIALLPNHRAAIISQDSTLPDQPHVTIVDHDGNLVGQFASSGLGPGELRGGHDIASAKDGTLFTAEISGRRIQKFTPVSK